MINVVVKALQLYFPSTDILRAVSFPDNEINANFCAYLTGAAAVTQIFDHNGDPILNPSISKIRDKVIDAAFSYTKLSP